MAQRPRLPAGDKRVFKIGDGVTRIADAAGTRPHVDYQPPKTFGEVMEELHNAFDHLGRQLAEEPGIFDLLDKMTAVIDQMERVDPVADARARSKRDLDQKRRELRRKGKVAKTGNNFRQ